MPNGTYGGVRGEETKVGQKTFVSRPTRLSTDSYGLIEYLYDKRFNYVYTETTYNFCQLYGGQ